MGSAQLTLHINSQKTTQNISHQIPFPGSQRLLHLQVRRQSRSLHVSVPAVDIPVLLLPLLHLFCEKCGSLMPHACCRHSASVTAETSRVRGRVKWYSETKGERAREREGARRAATRCSNGLAHTRSDSMRAILCLLRTMRHALLRHARHKKNTFPLNLNLLTSSHPTSPHGTSV